MLLSTSFCAEFRCGSLWMGPTPQNSRRKFSFALKHRKLMGNRKIPKMSRCLKWVAVKDGEPILCGVRATPWAYPFRPVLTDFLLSIFRTAPSGPAMAGPECTGFPLAPISSAGLYVVFFLASHYNVSSSCQPWCVQRHSVG